MYYSQKNTKIHFSDISTFQHKDCYILFRSFKKAGFHRKMLITCLLFNILSELYTFMKCVFNINFCYFIYFPTVSNSSYSYSRKCIFYPKCCKNAKKMPTPCPTKHSVQHELAFYFFVSKPIQSVTVAS